MYGFQFGSTQVRRLNQPLLQSRSLVELIELGSAHERSGVGIGPYLLEIGSKGLDFRAIPQKKKLSNDFLQIFPDCSLLIPVLRTAIKKTSHRTCLRDLVGQSYPVDACTDTNRARYFIGSGYISRELIERVFKVTLKFV